MDVRVERRIRDAMRRGSEKLDLFSSGRRRFIAPSRAVLSKYGPTATGATLLRTLKELSRGAKKFPPSLREEDIQAWKRLFANSRVRVVATTGREAALALKSDPCSEKIRDILEIRMRTNEWFVLKILGALSQQKRITEAASKRTWDTFGFYDIYTMLAEARNPAWTAHDALVTVARMAAYTICLIEEYSPVEEIAHANDCLTAIVNGTLPIAYSQKTETIYLGNWYNL